MDASTKKEAFRMTRYIIYFWTFSLTLRPLFDAATHPPRCSVWTRKKGRPYHWGPVLVVSGSTSFLS